MKCIFETERLFVRELVFTDLEPFHEMQGNKNVMKYVSPTILNYTDNKTDLIRLINLYEKKDNDFLIYAIERKLDNAFIGSVALVKDDKNEEEIGYRYLEKYWRMGYGNEVVKGLIIYCKQIGFKRIVAYVVNENFASARILERCGFTFVENTICKELNKEEKKYSLNL